jgi:hypothetical protein
MKKTVETNAIQQRWNEIRSAFQQLNRVLPPNDGTKPDLSVTISKAANLKAATQAMISTLKAQRKRTRAKMIRGRPLRNWPALIALPLLTIRRGQ